jgi:hypothetical protein
MCIYKYENGKFYVNDPGRNKEQGAGVEYTEEQMETWYQGRPNSHPAVALKRK